MIALGIDTSSLNGSVAVSAADGRVDELVFSAASTHSEKLLPALGQLLDAAGRALGEVDVIAVAAGPGSFTGLRIGMATAKGLALACSKPLLGFSTLEAMALACARRQERPRGVFAVMIDAGRGEVYRGLYEVSDRGARSLVPEAALPPEAAARDLPEGMILCGSGVTTYRAILRPVLPSGVGVVEPAPPLAAQLASMALRRAREGGLSESPPLVPNYLRLSDAERTFRG